MSSNSLSQEEAVEILNKWGDDGFFRLNQFGNLISIEQITPFTCVTSSVQTQYEDRDIETRFEPYSGGTVDSGRPPDAWDIKIPALTDFTKAKNEYAVPQGERVETCTNCSGRGEQGCSPCSGSGKTTCFYCSGSGQTNCTSCGGSGYKTESRSKNESYYDYSRNTTEWRTVYENVQVNCYSCTFGKVHCYSCTFGKVTCSSCGGRGIVTCGTCSGYGQVKFYKVLVVKHSHKVQRAIINHSDVTDKKLFKTSGEVIVDAMQARIRQASLLLKDDKKLSSEFVQVTDLAKISTADCPSCGAALTLPNQEAAPICKDPWHDKQNAEEKDLISMVSLKDEAVSSIEGLIKLTDEKAGEILFQRLLVQGIDTYKIEYKRGGKPGKPIWIYGKEKKIFTTGTPPLNWLKVVVVGLLAVVVLAVLIGFIVSAINSAPSYQPPATQTTVQEKTAVAPKGAIVRQGPGAAFPKVGDVKKGQTVTLLDVVETAKDGGNWEKIRVGDIEGYVNQRLLTK